MQINFLTKEDLQEFKSELLAEFREILNKEQRSIPGKRNG